MKHKCLKYVLRFTLIGKLEKILKDASRIFKRYLFLKGTSFLLILSVKRKLAEFKEPVQLQTLKGKSP